MRSYFLRVGCVMAMALLVGCGDDTAGGNTNANDNTNNNTNVNENGNNNNVGPLCGDDVVDTGEECDGVDLDGQDCLSLGLGFISGALVCDGACAFDTSGCVLPTCGDGIVQADSGEECDDGAANSDTDPDACRTDCRVAYCGDGVIDPGNAEACDGLALGGETCGGLGYPGGSLACALSCDFDTSGCDPMGLCTQHGDCTTVGEYCEKATGDCSGSGLCTAQPAVCPGVVDPVCGCDNQTYGNRCEAARAGVNVDYVGSCVVGGCTANSDCMSVTDYCAKSLGDCAGVGQCLVMPQLCPMVYDPVCGCDGATYGNDCLAASAGVNVDYWGPC